MLCHFCMILCLLIKPGMVEWTRFWSINLARHQETNHNQFSFSRCPWFLGAPQNKDKTMFTFQITQQSILIALLIFLVRVIATSLDTIRVIFTMRSNKFWAWVLGFFNSLIWVLTFAFVLADIDNILNVIVYAGGFATGNVVGMWIEGKLAVGFSEVRIISSQWGAAILDALREQNYAVTEIPARGKDGMVSVITSSVRRSQLQDIEKLVREVDENAFITMEDVVSVRRGFWREK